MGSFPAWKSRTSGGSVRAASLVAALSALAFLAFLNATVLNVAIPDLARDLNADGDVAAWAVTSYVASLAAGLIAGGRLADSAGRRRTLALGGAAFALAALVGAFAPSAEFLIATRCVQGASAALVTPASFGLLLEATTGDRRTRAIGIWSSAAATSAFIGPPLGGVLIDLAGWRMPLALSAASAFVLIGLVARLPRSRQVRKTPTPMGAAIIGGVGAAAIVLAATVAPQSGSLAAIGALAGTGAIGIAALGFGGVSSRLIEPELLRRKIFMTANVVSVAFGFAAFSWLLAAPLFAATVWGWDALAAALSVAPGAVVAALAAWGAGRLPSRGHAWAIVAGATVLAVTMLVLAGALDRSPRFSSLWLPAGMLAGVAIGGGLASLSAIVAASVPAERFAEGAGINITARQLGGALGVAIVGALAHAAGGADPQTFTAVWLAIGAGSGLTAVGGVALLRSGGAGSCRPSRATGAATRYSSVRLET